MRIMVRFIACLLSMVFLAGFAGCGPEGKGGPPGERHPVVRGLTLETSASSTIPERLEVVGTVRAKNVALLSARIAGAVSAIFAKEGDRVPRGKLLLTIEALESRAGASGAAGLPARMRRAPSACRYPQSESKPSA